MQEVDFTTVSMPHKNVGSLHMHKSVYQAVAWVRGDSQIHLSLGQICYFIARVLSYDIDQKNMIAENIFRNMMLVRSNNIIA